MNRTKQPFDPSLPVKVYWNLHRHLYSVQQAGLVVGHTESVNLKRVSFKVSQAGRNRVLKEGRKNVHAFVIGTIDPAVKVDNRKITYNPYKFSSFVDRETLAPVFSAKSVKMEGRGSILASF